MRILKNCIWTTVIGLASLGSAALQAREEALPIEAFLPVDGYDNNDVVQIVLDGQLPNACYELGRTSLEVDDQRRSIRIEQFANVSEQGACADQSQLPEERRLKTSFSNEVRLTESGPEGVRSRNLSAGEWKLLYTKGGRPTEKLFRVGTATDPGIQNEINYAIVNNVSVSPATQGSSGLSPVAITCRDRIRILISGDLQNSCVSVDQDLASPIAQREGTLVLRPKVSYQQGVMCLQVMRPYGKEVIIDPLAPGRYLAHVRSASGLAAWQMFSVTDPSSGTRCPQATP